MGNMGLGGLTFGERIWDFLIHPNLISKTINWRIIFLKERALKGGGELRVFTGRKGLPHRGSMMESYSQMQRMISIGQK